MHSALFFLRVDALLEVVEIDPALHSLVQLRAQPLLLVCQLLQADIIAAAGRLRLPARLELLLQRGDLAVDGLKFPLLLIGKFQLFLPWITVFSYPPAFFTLLLFVNLCIFHWLFCTISGHILLFPLFLPIF